jgi:uncharacterized protein YggT (Ycf19 family)
MSVPQVLDQLSNANILHIAVQVLMDALILCLVVQFILSWVLRGQDNRFSRFFTNVTAPIVAPLDRLLPPISIGGVSFSIGFIVAWWAIAAVGLLINQALPAGW